MHIELPGRGTVPKKKQALRALAKVIAALPPRARRVQRLGLVARIGWGPKGRDAAIAAIDLANATGLSEVVLDGVVRKEADEAVTMAGLLQYLPPGLVGPVLRHAKASGIRVRTANLSDPETISRGVWTSLLTARKMSAHLGKYGCFPLTLEETATVVKNVQGWFAGWSAAPVLFVDQGVLSADGVDVGRDLMRGAKRWLTVVGKAGARVVLIDTVDKARAKKLLRSPRTPDGAFSLEQIAKVEAVASRLGIKVLWAGGLGMRDAFEVAKLGVFGIYVTSAVSKAIAATGVYAHEPSLPSVKEPQYDAVLRTKALIEAGFLAARGAPELVPLAEELLAATEPKSGAVAERALLRATERAWRAYWRRAGVYAR